MKYITILMKLSTWAKKQGLCYRTAWNYYKDGLLNGYQLPTGTIIIEEKDIKSDNVRAIIYGRVSSSENKNNLDSQIERLKNYSIARGYNIINIIREIGSGVNDKRKKLNDILTRNDYDVIVVEHKDRLTRFGYNYIELLLNKNNIRIDVINIAEDDKTDLIQDLISIITSFTARYYGNRRAKRKTEKIIKELTENEKST